MRFYKGNPLVACLLGALVLSGSCVGYQLWRNVQWRDQVRGLAGDQGEDFEAGKLQLLVSGTSVTGSNGPDRLSGFPYHPGAGYSGTSIPSLSAVQLVAGGAMLVTFILVLSRCSMPQSQKKEAWIGRMILLAIGIFSAAIAIVAVCTGHMRTTRSYELTPATDPLGFWIHVAVCAVLAAGAFSAALRKR